MPFRIHPAFSLVVAAALLLLAGCGGGTSTPPGSPQPTTFLLTVTGPTSGTGTVTSTPAGINCPSTCTATFAKNTPVTLIETPAAGYAFTGWGGACSGITTCATTISAATTVTATFSAPAPLTVTISGSGSVTSSPPGINCPGSCTANFTQNTPIALTATPAAGFSFGMWGGACSGSGTGSTCAVTIAAASSVTAAFDQVGALTVTLSGVGTGEVTSNPPGINCPGACSASFVSGTQVTLTPTPAAKNVFGSWTGACTGSGACTVVVSGSSAPAVNASFGLTLQTALNHIIIFAQENRSFDSYFGAMRQYWAQSNPPIPDQSFDGLPQFNPVSGAAPLQGPTPSLPGCDDVLYPFDPNANPPETNRCVADSNSPSIQSFHLETMCLENPSPSWNESHVDWDLKNPVAAIPTLDGYVNTSANDARQIVPPMNDIDGLRAMGYYNGDDLNFYYFMASTFATSDRFFSPVMSRTQINRMYLLAATSQGHAYPLTANDSQLSAPPIFEELQSKGISWKIYIHPNPQALMTSGGVDCPANDTTPLCLYQVSYLNMFLYGNTVVNDPILSQNLVPVAQFAIDAQNGTLPQVALIEPASASGLDEHPADFDPTPQEPEPCCSVQAGAAYVEGIVKSLMTSPSWKDSALLFTYDEFGGFYDHVPPQPAVKPDDLPPVPPPTDLLPGDVCTVVTGNNCDFVYTGYRVPFIAISPYSKKNYVSHVVADSTAMLKLIETRFGVAPLTARDAAQIDMSAEFFDFVNAPWLTPPSMVPAQNTGGACDLTVPHPYPNP